MDNGLGAIVHDHMAMVVMKRRKRQMRMMPMARPDSCLQLCRGRTNMCDDIADEEIKADVGWQSVSRRRRAARTAQPDAELQHEIRWLKKELRNSGILEMKGPHGDLISMENVHEHVNMSMARLQEMAEHLREMRTKTIEFLTK